MKRRSWILILSLVLALVVWQGIILVGQFAPFILPSPLAVVKRLGEVLADGSLARNFVVTLFEVLSGLLLGASLAAFLGYRLAKSAALERLLSPYLIASQAIPVVAIAPLLIIWFGSGLFSKVLICALTVFFPILVNTVVGIRAVPENLRDLMRSMRATPRQMLVYLEIPAALPVLLGGLRIGATLSVIGAVVGEFVGADRGLGFMINSARGRYDTALVFAAVITLVVMALALYGVVVFLEKRLLQWQSQTEKN